MMGPHQKQQNELEALGNGGLFRFGVCSGALARLLDIACGAATHTSQVGVRCARGRGAAPVLRTPPKYLRAKERLRGLQAAGEGAEAFHVDLFGAICWFDVGRDQVIFDVWAEGF